MNFKKEIEYQFPEYENLVEIHDTSIFHPSISFESVHTVFICTTKSSGTVILGVGKGEGWVNRHVLNYLQTTEAEDGFEAEWYEEGDIETS